MTSPTLFDTKANALYKLEGKEIISIKQNINSKHDQHHWNHSLSFLAQLIAGRGGLPGWQSRLSGPCLLRHPGTFWAVSRVLISYIIFPQELYDLCFNHRTIILFTNNNSSIKVLLTVKVNHMRRGLRTALGCVFNRQEENLSPSANRVFSLHPSCQHWPKRPAVPDSPVFLFS